MISCERNSSRKLACPCKMKNRATKNEDTRTQIEATTKIEAKMMKETSLMLPSSLLSEEDNFDDEPEKKLCTKQACAIQYCLNRYNHQEKYCKAFIDEWKRCRDKVR